MQSDKPPRKQSAHIRRLMLLFMFSWSVLIALSLAWSLSQHRQAFHTEMYSQAKAIHTMDMAYRNWVIHNGGVYVPVTKQTPPSPYLKDVPERDITTPSGRELTLLNSSYVTRQVHELMDQSDTSLRGHIASLKPINPVNKADAWETQALKAFEKGTKEVSGIEHRADGKTYFRFMQPMVTEKACLKCHAQQGYKVGDIRGGISVSIPIDAPLSIENRETDALLLGHGLIWTLGMLGLFIGGRREQQAIADVEKSEAEVRLLANSIAHAIYGQNRDGICTFANAACVQMLGYAHETELLGKDIHALMHHSRADGSPYPAEACPTHQSIRDGKAFHIDEEVLWRKDGSCFPAAYWSYPVVQEGECVGAVVTFLDITEQKRMGDELKQSQKLLNSIVEHMPSMVFLKDAGELRFELFNRAGERLLGHSRRDLLGKNDHDLFPAEQADFFTRKDRAVLESRKALEIPEEPIRTASGEERWLHTFKIGLYDEQDKPTHLLGISMDITERKLAELRLRQSQDNLVEAQRIAHAGSWELDLATNQVFWSAELYTMYGYDPTRPPPLYTESRELFTPESWERLSAAIARATETGTPYELELEFVPKAGGRRWMLARGELVRDAGGKAVKVRGVVMDITERKLAEIKLRKSQQGLAEAQRIAHVGSWELDLTTDSLAWSDEIYRMFEIDPERFGASYEAFLDTIHPEDREAVNKAYSDSLQNRTPYQIEHRLLMKDGRIKYVLEQCETRFDESGKPLRSTGIVQDISERKLAEQALRESKQRYDDMARRIPVGIYRYRFSADGSECFDYVSPQFCKILDLDEAVVLRDAALAFAPAHPDDLESLLQANRQASETIQPFRWEGRFIVRGETRWIKIASDPNELPSGGSLWNGVVSDVTERRQAEVALAHANRALQTLSTVNRELVHAVDENNLLQAICKAIVEEKGYLMAWVGYVQHDEAKSIKHMASAGDPHGVLRKVQPSWAEDELGTGPSGRAVRTGQTQISKEIANDPQYQSWKNDLLKNGCASSIALPLMDNGEVFGILDVYADEVDAFTEREVALLEEMAADLAFGVSSLHIRVERDQAMRLNEEHLARTHEALQQTVDAIARAVEARDPYTAGHQRRVADLACAIAAGMGLGEEQIEGIRMGGTIHDIGKIQVPAEMLTKPAGLTDIEYQIIKEHPTVGFKILKDIRFPWPVAEIAYQHHERIDGSGYPQGLKGDQICLEARIVAVADVVEAMSSHRPYRAGLGLEAALDEIRRNRDKLYDGQAVDACLALFDEGYQLP